MLARLNKRATAARDEGFTLIELLIVIVILGILAAIVVFAIGSTRGDATSSACKTDYKSIELAAEAAYTKSGSYPTMSKAGGVPAGSLLKSFPGGTSTDDYGFTYDSTANTITVVGTKLKNGAGIGGCDPK